jgi:hypothetical protein
VVKKIRFDAEFIGPIQLRPIGLRPSRSIDIESTLFRAVSNAAIDANLGSYLPGDGVTRRNSPERRLLGGRCYIRRSTSRVEALAISVKNPVILMINFGFFFFANFARESYILDDVKIKAGVTCINGVVLANLCMLRIVDLATRCREVG